MNVSRSIAHLFSSLGLVAAALILAPPPPLWANGSPVNIVLSYLDGTSNWGSKSAAGVAELITSEGVLRLTATDMDQIERDTYVAWLVDTASGESLSVTSFQVGADRLAHIDFERDDPIPERPWNMLLVTVEPEGSTPASPGSRHAIAGRFPLPAVSGGGRPGQLPLTGGTAPTDGGLMISPVAILAMLAVAGFAFAAGWGSRRRMHS